MNYLLDTSIVSYLADLQSPHNAAVSARFAAASVGARFAVSILTFYEAAFAAQTVSAFPEVSYLIETQFTVLPLPVEGAATALALDLTLVSNDALFRDFAAIEPRLTVEDWTQ